MTVLGLGVGLVLGTLFVSSGLQKIRAGDIVESAARYQILPDRAIGVLLPALPWVEVCLGVLVLIGVLTEYALIAAASLLLVFGLGMAVNLVKGRRIDCGCRAARRPISWRLVAENVGLAAVAGLAALTQPPGPLAALIGGTAALARSEVAMIILLVGQAVLLYSLLLAVGPALRRLRWLDRYQLSS